MACCASGCVINLHLCWGSLLCLLLVPKIMVVLECYRIT